MKKTFALLAMFAVFSSMADYSDPVEYKITGVTIWPNEPGCTMSFSDEATYHYYDNNGNLKPGFTGYNSTIGNTCTVYRNGEIIGTCLTNGGETKFTDYDVVPGAHLLYFVL